MASSAIISSIDNITLNGFRVNYSIVYDTRTDSTRCPFRIQFRYLAVSDILNTLEIRQDDISTDCAVTKIIANQSRTIVFSNPSQYHGEEVALIVNLISTNPATEGESLFQSAAVTFDVPESPVNCSLLISNISVIDETAANADDGQITITTSGAFGTLTYQIKPDGGSFGAAQSSNVFTALAPGDYTAKAIDAGVSGCEAESTFTVSEFVVDETDIFFIRRNQVMGAEAGINTVNLTRKLEETGVLLDDPNIADLTKWNFNAGVSGATFTSEAITIGQTGIGECLETAENTTAGLISNGNKNSKIQLVNSLEFTLNGCDELRFSFDVFIGTNNVIKKPKLRPVQWQLAMVALNPFNFYWLNKNGQFHEESAFQYNAEIIAVGEWVTIEVTGLVPESFSNRDVIVFFDLFNADESGVQNPHYTFQGLSIGEGNVITDISSLATEDLSDEFVINAEIVKIFNRDVRDFRNYRLTREEDYTSITEDINNIIPDDVEDSDGRIWKYAGRTSEITLDTGENRITETYFRQVIVEWTPKTGTINEFLYSKLLDSTNKANFEKEYLFGDAPKNVNNSFKGYKYNTFLQDGVATGSWHKRGDANNLEILKYLMEDMAEQLTTPSRKISGDSKSKEDNIEFGQIIIEDGRKYMQTSLSIDDQAEEFTTELIELKQPVFGEQSAFTTGFDADGFR